MGMHVEQDHGNDPAKVSLKCSTCQDIMHAAEQHIEEQDAYVKSVLDGIPFDRIRWAQP